MKNALVEVVKNIKNAVERTFNMLNYAEHKIKMDKIVESLNEIKVSL